MLKVTNQCVYDATYFLEGAWCKYNIYTTKFLDDSLWRVSDVTTASLNNYAVALEVLLRCMVAPVEVIPEYFQSFCTVIPPCSSHSVVL